MTRDTLFGRPGRDASGVQCISTLDTPMMMDIKVHRLEAGRELPIRSGELETAVLLLRGRIRFSWEGRTAEASRKNCFDERPWVLHVCRDTSVAVTALEDSELLVQQTANEGAFDAKLYRPEDCDVQKAKYDVWESTAKRDIVTVFDYNNAPWSNMVLGEVITYPGRWSSYIPHGHEQPEVYYYRFDKPQGFGACFIGDDVFKITDGSFCAIPGGPTHPQVTAPGYTMYYAWMIRHFEGNPWTDRVDDPAHLWLLQQS